MLRAVLDPGVVISGLISSRGAPSELLDRWRDGEFELVASEMLLSELTDVLARPRLTTLVEPREAQAFGEGLRRAARVAEDPKLEHGLTRDPDDDYLMLLARAATADVLVSGDVHLLELANADPPVLSPRAFADLLGRADGE